MLGGIPPSIQHGQGLWTRNFFLPLMTGERSWGSVQFNSFDIYRYWGTYTNIEYVWCRTTAFEVDEWPSFVCMVYRVDAGWKVPKHKGDAGWKFEDAGWKLYGEVRKWPKYLNREFFANIKYHNSASRNRVVPFIHWDTFQHTRFSSCEFL